MASLETLAEIMTRVESDVKEVKGHVKDQNGAIREISDWIIRHEAQLRTVKWVVMVFCMPILLYISKQGVDYLMER